jgi:hypothetical protein
MNAETEIARFNRVLGIITENCNAGSKYHPEQAARDVIALLTDKCEGCGKLSFESCPRSNDTPCFREFHGGQRAAR